jgi:hypothetical protein
VSDYPLDIEHGDRVDAGKRLIQQHESRIGSERAGNLDPASFTARQADAQAGANVADVQFIQQLIQLLFTPWPVEIIAVFEDGKNILLNG